MKLLILLCIILLIFIENTVFTCFHRNRRARSYRRMRDLQCPTNARLILLARYLTPPPFQSFSNNILTDVHKRFKISKKLQQSLILNNSRIVSVESLSAKRNKSANVAVRKARRSFSEVSRSRYVRL